MVRVGRDGVLEDVSDGKKYLEEVMGIVEDEEFNRRRKLKALRQKQTTGRLKRAKTEIEENFNDSDTTWCGTKLLFLLLLVSFLLTTIIVLSDYRGEDELYLRRFLQSDRATVMEFVRRKYSELTTAFREEERDNRKYTDKTYRKGKLKQEFG